MSMHIMGPHLTTTSTKKRVEKITKAQQEELERGWRDRNHRLKQMGLPKETLEQYMEWVYGRGKKKTAKKNYSTEIKTSGPEEAFRKTQESIKRTDNKLWSGSSDSNISANSNLSTNRAVPWIKGPVSSKPSPTYTGENIIGIAVLHKSCLQPIFNKEAAEDVAKMRR